MCGKRGAPIVLVALAATLVGALGARAETQHAELIGRPIVAIEIDCAAPIDRGGLLRLMPMKVGDSLREEDLDEARWRLKETRIFSDVSIDAQPRAGEVAVVIHLVRKSVLNSVRFRGNDEIGNSELRRAVRLSPGMIFSEELRDYALGRIRDRYQREGFDAAQIAATIREQSPGEVDLIFDIDEGKPLRVGTIDINGKLPVAAEKVRKALGIKTGDRYARDKQRAAEKAIVRLLRRAGYYEVQVDSDWKVTEDKRGTLRFDVDTGPLFRIEFSGNKHFCDRQLLGLMDLPNRAIITDGTWRELARRVRRTYQEGGYYFAKVDLKIEPGPPRLVHFDVQEDGVFHVGGVSFDGNHGLSRSQLIAPMATRPPSWVPWRRGAFLDDVLDDDLKRLWYLYREYGYESAQIVDVRTRFDHQAGKVFVTVFIEEGPQTIVRAVKIEGLGAIAGRLPELSVKQGEPLNPNQVKADRQALITALAKEGYAEADVKDDITRQPQGKTVAAAVRYEATPGTREHIGAIIVQDNIDTKSRVVMRELPFKSGDPLSPDALLSGQTDIYRLGLFRSVTVRPVDHGASAATRDVVVSVSEKPAGSIQWGAGYNTRDGFRGFGEISNNNLQGLGRRLGLRGEFNLDPADPAANEFLADLGFREPRLDETRWSLRSDLIAQRSTRSVDQFSVERYAFIPAIERSVLPNLRTGLELQIEQAQVFDVASDVLAFNPRDQGRLRTVSVGPYAIYDRRDDPFMPRRGTFDSVRLRYAPGELGSDVPFTKLIWQHSQYVPLSEDLDFVYAVRGGWARAINGGDEVPIRERFFLGGRTTVRGFSENSIGPTGSLGDPIGGDLVVNLNTELRFPLAFGVGGAVFVDGGGLYLQDRAISIHDFRRAAGLGLRYMTPVGPISLDYGFKLDRRSGESIGEVHFSIGTIF
jgi:outer membrane protein insertion porin family